VCSCRISCLMVLPVTLGAQTRGASLSVCDVLGDLQKYNGKMVHVRGVLHATGESMFLEARCPVRLVTQGYKWPDAIGLMEPDDSSLKRKVDFSVDRRSMARLKRALGPAQDGLPAKALPVVVFGQVDSPKRLMVVKRPDGTLMPAGTGPSLAFPAQIIYRSFSEIGEKEK
jgi:hypothetical protein